LKTKKHFYEIIIFKTETIIFVVKFQYQKKELFLFVIF